MKPLKLIKNNKSSVSKALIPSPTYLLWVHHQHPSPNHGHFTQTQSFRQKSAIHSYDPPEIPNINGHITGMGYEPIPASKIKYSLTLPNRLFTNSFDNWEWSALGHGRLLGRIPGTHSYDIQPMGRRDFVMWSLLQHPFGNRRVDELLAPLIQGAGPSIAF